MFSLRTWAMSMGGIAHPLLADFWPHGGVAAQFGIFNEAAGIANRALFVIDPDGVVRFSERHEKTLPEVAPTLATLDSLQA